jgi:hypothetical protein
MLMVDPLWSSLIAVPLIWQMHRHWEWLPESEKNALYGAVAAINSSRANVASQIPMELIRELKGVFASAAGGIGMAAAAKAHPALGATMLAAEAIQGVKGSGKGSPKEAEIMAAIETLTKAGKVTPI